MEDGQRLQAKRRGFKSCVTKLLAKISDTTSMELERVNSDSVTETQRVTVASVLAQLKTKRDQIVELDNSIAAKIQTEVELEEEICNADTYQSTLEERIAILTEFIRKAEQPLSRSSHPSPPLPLSTTAVDHSTVPASEPPAGDHSPSHVSAHVRDSDASGVYQHVSRLPKLTLPTFSGDPLQWKTFWDSFNAAVHSNVGLSGVQKFNYLRAQLHGDAARVIAGFPLTDSNYAHSVTLLEDRFGQPYKLVNAHMEALLNLGKPSNNLPSLQAFYDSLEKHMRALSSLGKSSESYGCLLTSSILSKLPSETKKHMARENCNSEWTITEVMAGILKEIQIFEMSQQYTGKSSIDDHAQPTTGSFHTATDATFHSQDGHQRKEPVCVFCRGAHKTNKCNVVTDPKERLAIVKRDGLCFNCLARHKASRCSSKFTCRGCKKRHHTSLCQSFSTAEAPSQNMPDQPTSNNQQALTTMASTPLSATYTSVCLLKTAIAQVSSSTATMEGNILFDEGAQRSFVTQKLADELQLQPTHSEIISVSSFGAQVSSSRRLEVASMFVHTLHGNRIPISVLIVPQLAAPIRNSIRACLRDIPYLQRLPLAHPVTGDENFEISILIGADYYWHFIQDNVVRGDGPTAVQSHLGYLLSGPLHLPKPIETSNFHVAILSCTTSNTDSCYPWKSEFTDTMSSEDTMNDAFFQQYIKTHITTRPDGSYSLRFPWKVGHQPLPSNYTVCSRRTRSLAYRLAKTPELLKQYGKIIEEQERRGFIEKVDDNSHKVNIHYIPHHPVKKESSTTPIRIVYDCSCKQTSDSPSLNDCLHSGPPSLNDLCAILIRFRQHCFAFSADIEKAFLHVHLDEADRDTTRFLWLSDPADENSPFVTYRFRVVLFGATSSPFMLHAALTFHLTQNITVVSQDLLHNLYVDNIVSGCSNEQAAVEYFTESRSLLNNAGFNLRSWSSNCTQLQSVASQHKVAESHNPVKVLGVFWNVQTDHIYLTPSANPAISSVTTKREILRWSSSIFDPLGLISPVTIPAKILIQQLWQQRVGWDTVLNTDLHNKWHMVATNITQATSLPFPRKYNAILPTPKDASTILHVFADASPKAYGAAAYIQQDQNPASLVMSKSRTAPLKQLTLPKLELKAAVLAARLSVFIRTSLNIDCTLYLWSDSQIVLYWISSQKTLKPFVSHRVNQIRSISTCWNYCPSADNPADLLTRGVTFQQLSSSTIWKQGPSWLTSQDLWPRWEPTEVLTTQLFTEPEGCESNNQSNLQSSPADFLKVMDINRYSSLQKLLAVTAYVLRFTNIIRRTHSTNTKHLTTFELTRANLTLLRAVQYEVFLVEISNLKSQSHRLPLVRQLRLFLDEDQLIRCGGRIHNAPLSELARFPYLLPSKHYFTNLVILQVHIAQHHSGVNSTLTTVRQQYWIPSGRQRVRSLLRKCVICRKATGKAYSIPDPPPLVKCRVNKTQPFEVTGVDFTGALYVRGREGEHKVYICLFTCAVSRAVHLEVVMDLSMECFLQAFRRFASRRSLPRLMLSDNATTYLAAAEELQKLLSSAALRENLCRRGVEWRFIPKRAPWFGGFWERLIALTKSALKKVLGRTHATLESLQTIVVEVEAVLNNRPLTHTSSDVTDAEPITPSHLLYGRPIVSLPHRDVQDDEIDDPTYGEASDIERRTKIQSQLLRHFWNRWSKEYLTALREFHRVSGTNTQTVRNGDVVLIHDDTPRINWRLAVVERLNKGADGLTRSADIRTSTGRTNRPIARLYPLEVTAAEVSSTDDESARKEPAATADQAFQPRPVRDAAVRGRHKVQQWTNTLQAPPEDVMD